MEENDQILQHCKFEVPEIIFGRGLLSQVGSCARRLGGRKVFLVSDQGLFNAGWVDQVMHSLMEAGLDVRLFRPDNPSIPRMSRSKRGPRSTSARAPT